MHLGTLDFLGINHYFSINVSSLQETQEKRLKLLDSNFALSRRKELPDSNPMWIEVRISNL